MDIFELFLKLGIRHILSISAFDHILFITVLCIVYPANRWKQMLILITAFTVGHSLTLALALIKSFVLPAQWIEIGIACTILFSALSNIYQRDNLLTPKIQRLKYILAFIFGLIHGWGFSSYLKSVFSDSIEILPKLFAFNLGIELGQICVVSVIFIFNFLIITKLRINSIHWNLIVSGAGAVVSTILILQRTGII